jgi:hypothetical protein
MTYKPFQIVTILQHHIVYNLINAVTFPLRSLNTATALIREAFSLLPRNTIRHSSRNPFRERNGTESGQGATDLWPGGNTASETTC